MFLCVYIKYNRKLYKSLLLYVDYRCHPKVLAFLIKPDDDPKTKGADLNAKDEKNLTALQIAVRAGCLQSLKLLIENGSDVNSQVCLIQIFLLHHII